MISNVTEGPYKIPHSRIPTLCLPRFIRGVDREDALERRTAGTKPNCSVLTSRSSAVLNEGLNDDVLDGSDGIANSRRGVGFSIIAVYDRICRQQRRPFQSLLIGDRCEAPNLHSETIRPNVAGNGPMRPSLNADLQNRSLLLLSQNRPQNLRLFAAPPTHGLPDSGQFRSQKRIQRGCLLRCRCDSWRALLLTSRDGEAHNLPAVVGQDELDAADSPRTCPNIARVRAFTAIKADSIIANCMHYRGGRRVSLCPPLTRFAFHPPQPIFAFSSRVREIPAFYPVAVIASLRRFTCTLAALSTWFRNDSFQALVMT